METWGLKYWPVFLIISCAWLLLAFGIPEAIALVTHSSTHLDNTLSNYARTQLGVAVAVQRTVHTVAWWISFIVWMVFVVWITAHIWFVQFG